MRYFSESEKTIGFVLWENEKLQIFTWNKNKICCFHKTYILLQTKWVEQWEYINVSFYLPYDWKIEKLAKLLFLRRHNLVIYKNSLKKRKNKAILGIVPQN